MIFDICIIGGGASGMMAAITAKMRKNDIKVVVLEQLDRVGKKLSVTGNGRCNITNRSLRETNYYGTDTNFCNKIFENFSVLDAEEFFEKIGIPIIYEGDKGYPASLQAASVTDALRFKCDELGITTLCKQQTSEILKNGDVFAVKHTDGVIKAKTVIAAAGMLSGGQKMGSDGAIFNLLKRMGHTASEPSPAIVQLNTDTEFVRQLKGIKVEAAAKLIAGSKTKRTERGEVLFCDYGLSGPPILQLSGSANKGDIISLDLMPDIKYDDLLSCLKKRQKNLNLRKNDEFLSGLFNKRLGQVVLKRAGLSINDFACDITAKDLEKICAASKGFELICRGNTGFINSQATRGGLLTKNFDNTLMSKKINGLFACGEILDITGDCGGYNLQWAWSSGFSAANGAVEYLERK